MISETFAIPHISTGDIFRANVKGETPLGKEAKGYMDKGELVPDSVTNRMVADRLRQPDAENGFLLDGYPRNVAQAHTLNGMLAMLDETLDTVLHFSVPDDELEVGMLVDVDAVGSIDEVQERVLTACRQASTA
jgi:adenylate kinase